MVFDVELNKKAIHNAENPFKEGLKTLSLTFKDVGNGNALPTIEKLTTAVSRSFKAIHSNGCYAVNSKVDITIYSIDENFDFSSLNAYLSELKNLLDTFGMKRASIIARHIKSENEKVCVEISFKDVSPLDLYRTKGVNSL